MQAKYAVLLEDRSLARWYRNLERGSPITASTCLRNLGLVCSQAGVTPRSLTKMSDRKVYEFLLDLVERLERAGRAGGYIASVVKAVKSWLVFNDRTVGRPIRIAHQHETPTLRDERVPSPEELRGIFLSADEKGRVACVLMAHAGLRPEVLGNFLGSDGLRIGDLPDLVIRDGAAGFTRAPAMVRVRAELSKKRHEYFTFLSAEGCEYLKAYLEMRIRRGEAITGQSPVITPKTAKKEFIRTINIGDAVRKAIRKAGFPWRPYVLRSYFATQMMLAESKGKIIRDYRQFFMGHKGDIEAVYTLNKRVLPAEVVEQMRESYAKAQQHLRTVETLRERDVVAEFKRQLLLVAGFKPEEIKDEHFEFADEEFHRLIRDRLLGEVKANAARQTIVSVGELDRRLSDGWEFVSVLPNGRAVVKQAA